MNRILRATMLLAYNKCAESEQPVAVHGPMRGGGDFWH